MRAALDKKRFGPWALVTGASSGIGKEFARQIAASGINVVLVARRESLLDEVGQGLAKDFSVRYRNVVADLSQDGFLDKLAEATNDLDIGLVVSNARKARTKKTLEGVPVHSFQTLLTDLSTIVRNSITPNLEGAPAWQQETEPSALQQRAFDLLKNIIVP